MYITGSCNISKGYAKQSGAAVFENRESDFSSFLLSLYQNLQVNYPKFYKMDNLSKLGWLASELLLKENFLKDSYYPEEIGVVLANASSSLDNDLKYYDTITDVPSPSVFVYTLPNIVIGEICIKNNFKGEHAFFIQDTFDAGFIKEYVGYLMAPNMLKACICGWIDVLGNDYKAVLFLVEHNEKPNSILFSQENMENIFKAN